MKHYNDQCLNTAPSAVVGETGCSIAQLCPCAGQKETDDNWKNYGQYRSSVAKSAESFPDAGLITEVEKDAIVSAAGKSGCDSKK